LDEFRGIKCGLYSKAFNKDICFFALLLEVHFERTFLVVVLTTLKQRLFFTFLIVYGMYIIRREKNQNAREQKRLEAESK